MKELQDTRDSRIANEKAKRHVLVREKELEIDRLDEALTQYEITLNEEINQIQEERKQAVKIIEDTAKQTIGREEKASSALKGWYALQERRLQTLKAQRETIMVECDNEQRKDQ